MTIVLNKYLHKQYIIAAKFVIFSIYCIHSCPEAIMTYDQQQHCVFPQCSDTAKEPDKEHRAANNEEEQCRIKDDARRYLGDSTKRSLFYPCVDADRKN